MSQQLAMNVHVQWMDLQWGLQSSCSSKTFTTYLTNHIPVTVRRTLCITELNIRLKLNIVNVATLKRGTRGRAPTIGVSHCSACPAKFIPGRWNGGSDSEGEMYILAWPPLARLRRQFDRSVYMCFVDMAKKWELCLCFRHKVKQWVFQWVIDSQQGCPLSLILFMIFKDIRTLFTRDLTIVLNREQSLKAKHFIFHLICVQTPHL